MAQSGCSMLLQSWLLMHQTIMGGERHSKLNARRPEPSTIKANRDRRWESGHSGFLERLLGRQRGINDSHCSQVPDAYWAMGAWQDLANPTGFTEISTRLDAWIPGSLKSDDLVEDLPCRPRVRRILGSRKSKLDPTTSDLTQGRESRAVMSSKKW